MTNKLYRTCIKVVLEKSAFLTPLIFYFISCEVGRRTQPCSVHLNSHPYHSDTRWFRPGGLDLSCMTCIFEKIHWPLRTNDWLSQVDRAVVDSNRSVNLLFNIRKILCSYPRKRKDIRADKRSSNVSDRRPIIVPGWRLTCIRRGDLFVSWSGCREDQTP